MNQTATPHTMHGCTPAIQQARQEFLDTLYTEDGRLSATHQAHGLYTGLWAKYVGEPCSDEF